MLSSCKKNHRGISPVITHLLLIAVAVIGGTITIVSAQEHINSTQVSGYPQIELVKFLGYDARDTPQLQAHNGDLMSFSATGGFSDDGIKGIEERIAIHIQNHSPNKITIAELRFGGTVFSYDDTGDTAVSYGSYAILTNTPQTILSSSVPEIQSGKEATILIGLDSQIKVGRAVQFKITTNNNSVVVSDLVIGARQN